jgi:hypothetical protein
MYRSACVLAMAAAVTAGGAARASDPIGGYLLVDKVILDPADGPATIQIWGSIALAKENHGFDYKEPVRGYLYYKAPAGKEDVCRKEWNDLKKAAGTGQVIGFGSRYDLKALGSVRKANVKPETPDTYPVADGLVKIEEGDETTTFTKLRTLPAPQQPGDGDLVPPGEITLITRNIIDKKHAKAKYVFVLEGASGGKEEETVAAGDKETRWTPKMKLKAGEKYTWRVHAVEGGWQGPAATSGFVVKGEK